MSSNENEGDNNNISNSNASGCCGDTCGNTSNSNVIKKTRCTPIQASYKYLKFPATLAALKMFLFITNICLMYLISLISIILSE